MTSPIDTASVAPTPLAPAAPPKPPQQFAGSIPEDYDRHLGPLLFEFSGRDMAERVEASLAGRESARVLEVACGTGISTEHLWRHLPPGSEIVATDLSPAMLDHAKARRGELPGVRFEPAPADDLPYPDACFDALVCQFGIMFFDDKAKALAEFARVLAPGGRLAFSVWESHQKNPVVGLAHRTIGSFFAEDPPRFLEVPFSYHDLGVITDLVEAAGFGDCEVWRVRETVRSHDARSIARGFVMGNPCVNEIRERGSADPDAIIEALASKIEAGFAVAPGASELALPLEEITFTAHRR